VTPSESASNTVGTGSDAGDSDGSLRSIDVTPASEVVDKHVGGDVLAKTEQHATTEKLAGQKRGIRSPIREDDLFAGDAGRVVVNLPKPFVGSGVIAHKVRVKLPGSSRVVEVDKNSRGGSFFVVPSGKSKSKVLEHFSRRFGRGWDRVMNSLPAGLCGLYAVHHVLVTQGGLVIDMDEVWAKVREQTTDQGNFKAEVLANVVANYGFSLVAVKQYDGKFFFSELGHGGFDNLYVELVDDNHWMAIIPGDTYKFAVADDKESVVDSESGESLDLNEFDFSEIKPQLPLGNDGQFEEGSLKKSEKFFSDDEVKFSRKHKVFKPRLPSLMRGLGHSNPTVCVAKSEDVDLQRFSRRGIDDDSRTVFVSGLEKFVYKKVGSAGILSASFSKVAKFFKFLKYAVPVFVTATSPLCFWIGLKTGTLTFALKVMVVVGSEIVFTAANLSINPITYLVVPPIIVGYAFAKYGEEIMSVIDRVGFASACLAGSFMTFEICWRTFVFFPALAGKIFASVRRCYKRALSARTAASLTAGLTQGVAHGAVSEAGLPAWDRPQPVVDQRWENGMISSRELARSCVPDDAAKTAKAASVVSKAVRFAKGTFGQKGLSTEKREVSAADEPKVDEVKEEMGFRKLSPADVKRVGDAHMKLLISYYDYTARSVENFVSHCHETYTDYLAHGELSRKSGRANYSTDKQAILRRLEDGLYSVPRMWWRDIGEAVCLYEPGNNTREAGKLLTPGEYDAENHVVKVNSKSPHLMVNSGLAEFLDFKLHLAHKVSGVTQVEPRRRFKLVEGVPGCGKTSEIIRVTSRGDLAAAASRAATAEINERLVKAGKTYAVARTVGSWIHGNRVRGKTLIIDEGLKLHPGEVIYIAERMGIENVLVFGDRNQLDFKPRVPGYVMPVDPIDWIVENRTTSYTAPVDVVVALGRLSEKGSGPEIDGKGIYPAGFFTKNTGVERSMKKKVISSASEIPRVSGAKYITWTQKDKGILEKMNFSDVSGQPINTIDEFQGGRHDHVVLVRLDKNLSPGLRSDRGQATVAITRHTQKFDYVVIEHPPSLGDGVERLIDRTGLVHNIVQAYGSFDVSPVEVC